MHGVDRCRHARLLRLQSAALQHTSTKLPHNELEYTIPIKAERRVKRSRAKQHSIVLNITIHVALCCCLLYQGHVLLAPFN